MSRKPCAFIAPHHSNDRVTVHAGRPDPITLCGYHASDAWLPTVLNTLSADRSEDTMTDNNLTPDEQFFYAHAGYSHNPATETEAQGHARTARDLAKAEAWARDNLVFQWWDDEEATAEDGEARYGCVAGDARAFYASGGFDPLEPRASLWAIGFADGQSYDTHDSAPYVRVVEAELALEVMPSTAD